MTIVDINQTSHVTLRAKPGVYVGFPVVDNKGVFDHFTTSNLEDCYVIDCLHDSDPNTFGLYKIESGIKYLIHAFSDKSELTVKTMDIIVNHFPHIIEVLGVEVKFKIATDISHMPKFHYEIIAEINGAPHIISTVADIEKLKPRETTRIKKFPGAFDAVGKYITLMAKKNQEAYQ